MLVAGRDDGCGLLPPHPGRQFWVSPGNSPRWPTSFRSPAFFASIRAARGSEGV